MSSPTCLKEVAWVLQCAWCFLTWGLSRLGAQRLRRRWVSWGKREKGKGCRLSIIWVDFQVLKMKRGGKNYSIHEVGVHRLNTKTKSQGNQHILACCLSPTILKEEKKKRMRWFWGSEQIKQSLTRPVRFLSRILELGISRGIERCQERPIYLRTAALSMGVLVIENSTLPSSCRIKLWSHKICRK